MSSPRFNDRTLVHAVLVCLACAAAFVLVWLGWSALDSVTFMALLYVGAEVGWAVWAIADQRHYARHPRRPFINELRGMVGATGVVVRRCCPRGQVRIGGELWQAESRGRAEIPEDTEIVVRRADSLLLEVEPSAAQQ